MDEIMNTVESLFGKDVKIVDCQTSSSMKQEELLLINGNPIKLDGIPNDDAKAIKSALLDGQIPDVEHLNKLLFHAGITRQPIEVETDLTVKSSLTTTEEVLVSRNGLVLNEHFIKTEEDLNHCSQEIEIWQPLKRRNKNSDNLNTLKLKEASSSIHSITSTTEISRAPLCNLDSYGTSSTMSSLTDSPIAKVTTIKESQEVLSSLEHQILSSNSKIISLGNNSINSSTTNLICSDSGGNVDFSSTPLSQCSTRSIPKSTSYDFVSSTTNEIATTATKDAVVPSKCSSQEEYGSLDSSLTDLLLANREDIQFAFILCVRLVEQPYQFLKKLSTKILNECSQSSTQRLLNLLELWLKTCPNDFRNKNFIQELHNLTDRCLQLHDNNFNKQVAQLLLDIPHILDELDLKYKECEEILTLSKSPSSSNSMNRQSGRFKSLKRFAMTTTTTVCKKENILTIAASARELAFQLTTIDHYYLKLIRPEELLEALKIGDFKDDLLKSNSTLLHWPCTRSNIDYYINWFNRLSCLIATEIVSLKKKSQSRIEMFEFWIETAMECFNIGNFNSLMAILTAFKLTAISRLQKMWSKVKSSKLPELVSLMDEASNFSSYRSIANNDVCRSEQESDKNEKNHVIIPFFMLFLKDLITIHESSNLKITSCKQLNPEEFLQLGSQMRNFSNILRATCSYTHNAKIINYLHSAQVFSEIELLLLSFTCEPPNNSIEKNQMKQLKTEQKLPKKQLSM